MEGRLKLRFGQIEEVLQCVHCIPKGERSQFRAKLRNLFRVGLDLPSGRVGRRANYDIADMLKLAFAAEILEIGLPKKRRLWLRRRGAKYPSNSLPSGAV